MEVKGSFDNIIRWLNRTKDKLPDSALNSIGRDAVSALRAATPVGETGQTASGWEYKIVPNRSGADISIFNNAHPGESVNIATIKEFGHGTGTGGYVAPRPYIKQAMAPVFGSAGDKVAKEMFK